MSNNLTNNTTENIHVKLQYNDEFRRFFIPNHVSSLKYADLNSKIKSLLHITEEVEIALKYKDEEDEWITISSDVELETGLLIAGNGIFRLLCELKSNQVNDITPQIIETQPFEERGNWRKYRDDNRGGYKGKGNRDRKWKKNYEGGKPRGGGRGRYHNSELNSENNSETAETPTSDEVVVNNENNGGGGRWRERKQLKKEFKRERKRDRKARRKRFDDEKDETSSSSTSGSDSNSDVALLTLDEIKKELAKLKDEESILKEKVKGAKENLKAVKDLIKEKRKDEKVQPDEILNLREDLQVKKKDRNSIQEQLKLTRSRMRTLREAAETKQV